MHPFANIENQVPAVAIVQPADQLFDVADTISLVSQRTQRFFNAVYRVGAVKFGGFDFAISCGQVGIFKVKSQAD